MNAQMQPLPKDIRALMIAVANGRVLVPNALVSEIITAASPEPIAGAPVWIRGRVSWRGWRVPLFSLSLLADLADAEPTLNTKITVLKALGGNPRMPFIAMTCIGFPRLTTVSSEELLPTGRTASSSGRVGVLMEVLLREDRAILPDLPTIESLIVDALQLGPVV